MKQFLTRLLREPLVHFFIVGGLLFALLSDAGGGPDSTLIEVSQERIGQLRSQFESTWNRTPSADELNNIVDTYIRDEVYYRDALALGLDKNDTVIRQRLRQKMEFLIETAAAFAEIPDSAVVAFYESNLNLYQARPRLEIEQVLIGQTVDDEELNRALDALRADPDIDRTGIGQRSLLPRSLRLNYAEGIDAVYGAGFFNQIRDFPVLEWSGPVLSSYGVHLVRILSVEPGNSPPLSEIREIVERDWLSAKADEIREEDFLDRLEKYTVRRVEIAEPLSADSAQIP